MTNKTVTVNVNEMVRVKLSKEGEEQYLRYRVWLYKDAPPRVLKDMENYEAHRADSEGFRTFHLWELMNIFGPALIQGPPTPFVDNRIEISLTGRFDRS